MPWSRMLALAVRFSLRELRGGLSGFMIFLTCIALGVAAIGGVNSVARSITAGVANEGQSLLGGDMRFELNQREASEAENGFPRRPWRGRCNRVDALDGAAAGRLRPGAGRGEGGRRRLSALWRAGDGARRCRPGTVRRAGGVFGAAAPDLLFERLGLKIGDRIKLGSATFELRAMLDTEPDAASDGFGFAPRLLVSLDALAASGLIQPGSLVEHRLQDPAGRAG